MKKGFTLIELLAVIVILAIIALIATPIILGVVENARKSAAGSSALGYLDAVEKAIALDSLDNIVYPTGEIEILSSEYYQDIEVQGEKPSKGRLTVTDRYLITSAVLCVNNYKVELTGHKIKKITKNACDEIKQRKFVEFGKDTSGAATPNLKGDLIPVAYDGENWIESDGTQRHWYNYDQKMWANAVILSEDGEIEEDGTIKEDDIDAFFVWIPKFRYQLWRVNDETSSPHEIPIEFNLNNTVDSNNECQTPMESGTTGTCAKDKWMTHPAFISFDVDGLWVGKFEVGYDGATSLAEAQVDSSESDKIVVKPNVYSWRGITVKNMFDAAYNYRRDALDSHMTKNTEWGAVAYLSHSKYGINKEVGMNNFGYDNIESLKDGYKTGCGAAAGSTYSNICNPYTSASGKLASTTGNITGVYDMSGGSYEYVASYLKDAYSSSGFNAENIKGYDKYFDVYINPTSSQHDFTGRILGDATDEVGPVNDDYITSWYEDHGDFVYWDISWVNRGGSFGLTKWPLQPSAYGIFYHGHNHGKVDSELGFRLALAPK